MPRYRIQAAERPILIFLLVLSLFIMLAGIWSLRDSWLHDRENAAMQARNQSLSLSRQAQDTFLQVNIALNEVAQHADDAFTRPQAYSGTHGVLAEHAVPLPQLDGLFIYDKNGSWLATSLNRPVAFLNNADRDYFIWHRMHSDTQVHIGNVILSRSSGEPVIPVSLRLNDSQGNFRGVVLGTVKVGYFRQYYSWYEQRPGDLLALMRSDGTLIYARPFADNTINLNIFDSPLFTMPLRKSLIGSATWKSHIDGRERLFGFARLVRYPLVAAVGFETRSMRETWLSNNIVFISVNILMWLMVLTFGVMALRQLRATLQARDELTRLNLNLSDLALLDGLTGLANRRQFDLYLAKSLAKSVGPVSLIMFDVDFFKRYNDYYGHVAGDRCLQEVATVLRHQPLRHKDRVARYGGEEFAIILPETDARSAEKVAYRAVEAIRQAAIPHDASELDEKIVTLSAGIGEAKAEETPDGLKSAADKALYLAKKAGRNCIANVEGVRLL